MPIMLSEKSIDTSLTLFRLSSCISSKCFVTSATVVPLTAAMSVPLLAVSVPVGEERDQVMVKHRLVYAQSLAHVLLLKHPLTGMLLLVPVRKATQMLLVGTPEVLPVSPEEAPHALGRHWEAHPTIFFKKSANSTE